MAVAMARDTVFVVGGGVIGLCTAWFLAEAGFRVQVLERRQDVGLETSFANGGMLTPAMSDPWNAPGVGRDLLRWIGRKDAPMLLRVGALGHYLSWGLRFLRCATPRHYRAALEANFRLASYSVAQTRLLRERLALQYEAATRGTMKVWREEEAFSAACRRTERLRTLGLEFQVLDAAGVRRTEPVLGDAPGTICGGIRFPDDETGDAWLFCKALRSRLERQGVAFSFDTDVTRLLVSKGRVSGLITDRGNLPAAYVVVAAGAWTAALLAPLGFRMPIRPVKGYSLTVTVTKASAAPRIAIIDDTLHAALTPLGQRLRIAGTAEFCGFNADIDPKRIKNLWKLAHAVSPRMASAIDRESAVAWCGFRPMSADGVPYIGCAPVRGLFVNAGHGHLGWTEAVGSGSLLAQLLARRTPEIDAMPYSVSRA